MFYVLDLLKSVGQCAVEVLGYVLVDVIFHGLACAVGSIFEGL